MRWGLRLTLALPGAATAVGLWNREEIARLWAVNTLFDEDRIAANHSAMDRALPHCPTTW